MKRTILLAATLLVAGCERADAPTQPMALAHVTTAASQSAITIRVEAFIDGRSRLILRGNTAQWYHIDHAAPGRWLGQDIPTLINEARWHPSWGAFSGEVRCGGCFSDVFQGVQPSLPNTAMHVEVVPVRARHIVSVVQHPSAANDYTTIIELDDNAPGGADTYVVDLSFKQLDVDPPTIALPLLATELWPPDHKMHLVARGISASDAFDPAPTVSVQVTSNEPANGNGDGDTESDWIVESKADGSYDVYVRAERSGSAGGRVYTISVAASDSNGNTSASSAEVRVPRSSRR